MILLMTTAPPEKAVWYLGKRLPPIGLMYVAAALEKAGFEVQMLDKIETGRQKDMLILQYLDRVPFATLDEQRQRRA